MILLDANEFSNLHYILLGEEEWSYLLQVLLKCAVMFIVVIATLRLIGRRGIMQGVFEVLTIIMLGSAAGDPMLYKNVGLLPAILIFITIGAFYRITDFIVAKYSLFETIVEGRAIRFVKDGRFDVENFRSRELSKDELFSDMRKEGVSHLGQIKAAYLEPGGEISIFYFEDEEVRYGMPLFPELNEQELNEINEEAVYACAFCGHTEKIKPAREYTCIVCKKKVWLKAIKERRIG
ncbi:MAG: DUF421 domain-containing protein [Parafilimonas sp.]|nr:DUF421 domain-containing protein [Parafilimonas sp.]